MTIRRLLVLVVLGAALLFTGIAFNTPSFATPGTNDYPSYLRDATQDSVVDPWQFYNRECTSFVAWRLNNDNKFAFKAGMGGSYGSPKWYGNASTWANAARANGVRVDTTPAAGAVAQWNSNHVAWVSKVNTNGSIVIEEYNYNYSGLYHSRAITREAGWPDNFIHFKDIPSKNADGFSTDTGGRYVPLAGDWDGDGKVSVGYFDRWDGAFHLRNALSHGPSDYGFVNAPTATDDHIVPVTGDWDGDGKTSLGYIDRTDGSFHLRNALSHGPSDYAFVNAPTGTDDHIVPVTGNWDGIGGTSAGYFDRTVGAFHLRNALSHGPSDYGFINAPTGTDDHIVPVTGNWDGIGGTSAGYFDRNDGSFHLRNALSHGPSDYAFVNGPIG